MSPRLCRVLRAFAAVTLLAGYYLIGLGMSGGLLYLSYVMQKSQNGYIHGLYFLAMFIGSVLLAFVVPHPRGFRAPGARLDPDDQPLFYEVVKRAAAKAGKPVPGEIYLFEDVDGGVTYRGGFLGIGSRPVMLIGFPLLHMLTVPQLEAMLVYWFAYFGESRPWIDEFLLETKDGVYRALHTSLLPGTGVQYNPLLLPFVWYRNLFNRTYGVLNKRQHRMAREVASRAVPRDALDAALAVMERHGNDFATYFHEDMSVSVRRGYHPPLMDGYRMYRESSGQTIDEPPEVPATSLLKGTHWLETWVLKAHTESPEKPLKWIGWDEAGENAALSHWEWLVMWNYSALDRVTLGAIPSTISGIHSFAAKTWARGEDDDMRLWYAEEVLVAALGCALYRAGWKIDYAPGAWSLRRGQRVFNPRRIISELHQAGGGQKEWDDLLDSLELDPATPLAPPQEQRVPLNTQ